MSVEREENEERENDWVKRIHFHDSKVCLSVMRKQDEKWHKQQEGVEAKCLIGYLP